MRVDLFEDGAGLDGCMVNLATYTVCHIFLLFLLFLPASSATAAEERPKATCESPVTATGWMVSPHWHNGGRTPDQFGFAGFLSLLRTWSQFDQEILSVLIYVQDVYMCLLYASHISLLQFPSKTMSPCAKFCTLRRLHTPHLLTLHSPDIPSGTSQKKQTSWVLPMRWPHLHEG